MDTRFQTISRLVDDYSRKLLAYSRLICRDTELARDAVADTFHKLCTLKTIDEAKIGAWLYKTCRNTTIDILRKQKFYAEFDESYISSLADDSYLPDILQRERLLALISKLPQQQREILMLRYFSDLKYSEIAEILKIPASSVGVSISRAIETLRQQQF